MGIPGLLQVLQPVSADVHIRSFANKAVAVDAYCWLHRGAYGCAQELAMGQKTDKYCNFYHLI